MQAPRVDNNKKYAIRKLVGLLAPYKKIFIIGMLGLAAGSGINLLFPELIRRLINSDLNQIFYKDPFLIAFGLSLLFIVQAICFYFRSYYFLIIGQLVIRDIRKKLFSSLMSKQIEFFDTARVGDLVSRLGSDSLMIQDALSFKISVFIRYSLQVICGIILMCLLSGWLTLLIVVSVPVLLFISRFFGKKLRYWSRLQQTELGASSAIADETFSAIRVVKAFNQDSHEIDRYNASADRVYNAGLKRSGISAFFSSFVSLLLNLTIIFVLLFGFNLVARGNLSAGDLTAFILYGTIVAVSFAFVVNSYSEFVQAIGATERIFDFLDSDPDNQKNTASGKITNLAQGIEFNDVTFAYPSRPDSPVIKGLSCSIKTGQITALVGPSGAGKSTIVGLILKFYAYNQGQITIDEIPIDQVSTESIRSQIAYVPQDPALFAMSIAENLRYAKVDATLPEIEEACRKANIFDFISQLPQKFETQVGEKGIQLSTGQRQRISIARAILRNPRLLILDEATSALDSENEFLVQEALQRLMEGRTTLVIAHRLSTVKKSDTIYVLNEGKIEQAGTHEALSSHAGLYRQLVEKQELTVGSLETAI